jgi:hypothetical protein
MSFPDFWQDNSVKDVVLGAVNSCLVAITCCIQTKIEAAYLYQKLNNNMCISYVLSYEKQIFH